MVSGLERYQEEGELHFVIFSCYRRFPLLDTPLLRGVFEGALDRMQREYDLNVGGYVIMPEHVHLLLSDPAENCSGLR